MFEFLPVRDQLDVDRMEEVWQNLDRNPRRKIRITVKVLNQLLEVPTHWNRCNIGNAPWIPHIRSSANQTKIAEILRITKLYRDEEPSAHPHSFSKQYKV